MNWDAAGAIGEIFGAAAVVATLIYLARQLREQGKSTISSTTNAWLADYNVLIMDVLRDPEFTTIFQRGLSDFESLNNQEQMRLHIWLVAHILNAQNVFMQFGDEIIHPEVAEGVLSFNAAMLNMAGGAYWWDTSRSILRPDFVEHMDDRIAKSGPVTDFWPWFAEHNEALKQ